MISLRLKKCIAQIEEDLACIYHFSLDNRVTDHLIDKTQMSGFNLDRNITRSVERAGVLVNQSKDDFLDIGVHVSEALLAKIDNSNPMKTLNETNIDAYCAISEEISHFHLIINRAKQGRQVTMIELEWQGEVDKLLISAFRLTEQRQDPHLMQLYLKIFSSPRFLSGPLKKRYEHASKYAANFWAGLISRHGDHRSPRTNKKLHSELRQAYQLPVFEKFPRTLDPYQQPNKAA